MTRYFRRLLPLGFCFGLLLSPKAAETVASETTTALSAATPNPTNLFDLKPGPDDPRIAFWTANLLPQFHYLHHPFDDSISSKFLDSYIRSLDPQHIHFLQSDLDQFEQYRTNLDNLTLNRRGLADVRPAYDILGRFVERLQQHVAYVDELLKSEKFEFNTDERMSLDRRDAPNPKNLAEAKQLWRQRLRFEYLTEKLGIETDKTKKPADDGANPAKTMHDQIVDTLTRRYHRTLRFFTDWTNDDVMGVYLTALAHAYDPHSDYFNKEELDNFRISMNLQLFGIGAELRSEDGYCTIQRLLPGGPAAKSKKIKEGERIVAVAQGDQPPVDVVDMNLTKVVQLIRGAKGTEVRLTMVPARNSSPRSVVTLVRDEIQLDDQAAKGKIFEMPDSNGKPGTTPARLGYINLPSFYAPMDVGGSKPELAGDGGGSSSGPAAAPHSTSADVAKLLKKFKEENVRGVILDLRLNGGGSLEEAIKLTGLFIKEGPVVQVRAQDSEDGKLRVQVDPDEDPSIAYEGPLIVLTSRFSASASEIVAGALQDYGRAIIVGDSSTHGKGTVQTLSDLNQFVHFGDSDSTDPGALKVTIRKFYRASGASTQLRGVMPDIVLPSRLNYAKDVGEKALDNPLEWDTIPSAKYQKMDLVQPYLGELLRRSNQRIATNEDFAFVRQDIDEYRKLQADKTVSLNEKERLKEIQEDDARQKAWERERLARKDSGQKVYEISLKQAVLPGLPPPLQNTNLLALANSTAEPAMARTNSVSIASATVIRKLDDDSVLDKAPPVDVDLDEAERIMQDYLSLLPKDSPLLANQNDRVIDAH